MNLISVSACEEKTLASAFTTSASLPLTAALGKVLAKDVLAAQVSPPFHRVAMDGIAIAFDAYAHGQRDFSCLGLALAGKPALRLTDPHACIEVATGAVLPEGCDTVIPYENLERKSAHFMLNAPVSRWQNVHKKGSDHAAGTILLSAGSRLFAPQIAALAALGENHAQVYGLASAHIMATGEELYLPGESVPEYGIYCSSAPAIAAMLKPFLQTSWGKVGDTPEIMASAMHQALSEHDCLVITGAVSKGAPDVVPEILKQLGANIVFHGVAQKPGKPFLFATLAEKFIFALPGNPVASLIVVRRYLVPFLLATMKLQDQVPNVVWQQHTTIHNDFTHFIPVIFEDSLAIPVPMTGSGDWGALAKSAGFIEIHKNSGPKVPFYPWRMEWN